MEDNFSTDGGADVSGGNVSDGEQWGAADEASLACPPLTSRCVAQFLAGCRPVLAGLGTPALGDLDIVCGETYHFSTVHIGKCSCEPS